MKLVPLEARYPFDRTGISRDNYVHGEIHELPPVNNRILVPKNGAFYANSLQVIQNQNQLVLGRDYELAGLYQDATVEVGQPVNVLVFIKNPEITGEITLNYQVVGGNYTGTFQSIQEYINALIVDPRKVHWDDILDKPEFYVPREHFHDINEVYGLNSLIPKFDEMIEAIKHIRSNEMRRVYERIISVKGEVESIIRAIQAQVQTSLDKIRDGSGDINTLRVQLNDAKLRIQALENNNSVRELRALIDNNREEIVSAIAEFDGSKIDATTYRADLDRLTALINGYFNDNGKLNPAYLPVSSKYGSGISVRDDGLQFDQQYHADTINDNRTTHWYIDAVNGVESIENIEPNSQGNPYRHVSQVLGTILNNTTNIIHLKSNQTHILPPNDIKIKSNVSITFVPWSSDDSYPTLQLGNTNKSPFVTRNGIKSNHCITLSNSNIVFKDIKLKVFVSSNDVETRYRTPIAKGDVRYPSTSTVTIEGNGATIDLSQDDNVALWDTPDAGLNTLVVSQDLLQANKITGNGRLFLTMNTMTNFIVRGQVNNHTERFNLNQQQVTVINQYVPQLRTSFMGVENVLTNISPETLAVSQDATLPISSLPISTDTKNLLKVLENKLYVGANTYHVYIDATGNDISGDGTLVKPFRTIVKAITSVNPQKEDTIHVHLKEGQEHIVDIPTDKEHAIYTDCEKIYFYTYGPVSERVAQNKISTTWNNDIVNTNTTIHVRTSSRTTSFKTFLRTNEFNTNAYYLFTQLTIKVNNLGQNGVLALNGHMSKQSFIMVNCRFNPVNNASSVLIVFKS